MNERNNPALPLEGGEEESSASRKADSTVAFAGDPELVSSGFAMALRLMGFDVPEPDASKRKSQYGD